MPMEGQPMLSLEGYEAEMRTILEEVVALKEAFEYTAKSYLTKAKLQMLHDGLDAAQDRIQALDERTSHADQSRERRVLIDLIDDVRHAYPLHSMAAVASAELSRARALHYQVRAAYATAESRLGLDDRRRFKSRITQLATQVRQAEHHHWMRLMRMARAQKAAPEIAEAITLT